MAAGMMVKQFLIDTAKTPTQTADITDAAILGQPKVVLFFANGPVGNHQNGGAASACRLIGWAADTTEGGGLKNLGITARSAHGVTTTAENGYLNDTSCINTLVGNFGTSVDGRVHVSSMLSNGFRFTYDEQFTLALSVMAVVLWGSDITNVEMVSFLTPKVGTPPFTEDHALPFVCSDKNGILFAMGTREDTAVTQSNDSDLCFGAAASSGEQACFDGAGDDALALPTPGSEVRRHADISQCFVGFNGPKSSMVYRMALSTWLGTGGFQVTWNATNATVDILVHCLVIKGGQWSVKSGTAPASGTVDVTGAGFNPIGAIVMGHAAAFNSANVHSPDMQESWGAFDATRNAAYAMRNLSDQTAATVVATRVEPDKCYLELTTAGAINAAMSGAPISDGVRLTVLSGDPSTHQFVAIMVGQNAAGGGGTGRPTPNRIVIPTQRMQRASRH